MIIDNNTSIITFILQKQHGLLKILFHKLCGTPLLNFFHNCFIFWEVEKLYFISFHFQKLTAIFSAITDFCLSLSLPSMMRSCNWLRICVAAYPSSIIFWKGQKQIAWGWAQAWPVLWVHEPRSSSMLVETKQPLRFAHRAFQDASLHLSGT